MRQHRMARSRSSPSPSSGPGAREPARARLTPWFVYLLHCADGTFYAGSTTDVEARARAHNDGRGARYTAGRTPVAVVYQEECESRSAALRREHALKRLTRSAKAALIASRRP
jgi:predicted GIY-YIG superfamily endonuclease